jgi:hypothetical protein
VSRVDEVSMRSAGMRVVMLCFVVIFMVSCSTPTGPSLTKAVLRNVALKATTGNTALCCCHVVGTAENDNAVPVHLTIEFSAFDGHNNALETIVQFVADLEAGTTQPFDAAGFVFPCDSIASITTQVNVVGIAFPPL